MLRQSGMSKVYVATAEAHDAEMEEKIARHKAARAGQGWRTLEAPRDLEPPLASLENGEAVLIDCITFWLSNQLLDEADLQEECDALLELLDAVPHPVVIVTNDVSGGVVPDNALARAFRSAQGRLNQRLAAQADLVILITAGLPSVLKGVPPPPEDAEDTAEPDDLDAVWPFDTGTPRQW